jgi:hypothetical protein
MIYYTANDTERFKDILECEGEERKRKRKRKKKQLNENNRFLQFVLQNPN